MRSRLLSTLTVLGAVLILVLAANTVALAATGKGFILGKANKARTMTVLQRTTPGAVLSLKSKNPAAAPLKVNGKGKVANLNADKIDGMDSSQLASKSALDAAKTELEAARADASDAQARAAALEAERPVATGYVGAGATFAPATSRGFSGVTWDAGNGRYLVAVDGGYYYNEFHTNVTPLCDLADKVHVSSVSNQLIVQFRNAANTTIQCGFTFSTTRLN